MFRRIWNMILRWFRRGKPGRGNGRVYELYHLDRRSWVTDVTGVVTWVKPVTEEELAERRRRFWRHVWRSFKEWMFNSTPDHSDRYPHQIFNIALEYDRDLEIRVENNLYTGKELKGVSKGMRIEVGGEYLPNNRGGKLHHTHGRRGYVRKR